MNIRPLKSPVASVNPVKDASQINNNRQTFPGDFPDVPDVLKKGESE